MNQELTYKLVPQKPYCCVPACLVMILDRRKIKHGLQEEIGCELGLVVPKEISGQFKKVKNGKAPKTGFGTQVSKPRYSINHYFQKHKIKLTETYFPPEKIRDYAEFINDNISQSNDVMVCFDNKLLFGTEDWPHVGLIQGIDKNKVSLIDPAEGKSRKRKVELENLIKAIEKHGKSKRGGLWVVSG